MKTSMFFIYLPTLGLVLVKFVTVIAIIRMKIIETTPPIANIFFCGNISLKKFYCIAFSRARLKLMIVTVSPREQTKDTQTVVNYYKYFDGLQNSVEKNLLEPKEVRKTLVERKDVSLKSLLVSDMEDSSDTEPLMPTSDSLNDLEFIQAGERRR